MKDHVQLFSSIFMSYNLQSRVFYILYKFRANVAMQICSYQAAPEGGIDLFKNDQRDRMQRPETILFMPKCFVLFACEYMRSLNTSEVFKLKWKFSTEAIVFLKTNSVHSRTDFVFSLCVIKF